MDNRFYKTREVFQELESTLNEDNINFSLKRYFTEYILIVLYRELEDKLLRIVEKFLKLHSNEALSLFLTNNLKTIFARMEKQDLRKTLKLFGKNNSFTSLTEQEIQIYENTIKNRNKVAHSDSILTLSWQDIKESIEIAEKIIFTFEQDLFRVI